MAKKKEEVASGAGVLDGITEKTTKAELLKRLRQAAKELLGQQDERVGRMQELEEKVRAKFQGVEPDIRSVTLMCSPPEFTELVDFLDNFEDIMPMALHRLQAGAKAVIENHDSGDVEAV